MGAPYAFPKLPQLIGQLMFWAGVLGLAGYVPWLFMRPYGAKFWHITEGLSGPLSRAIRMWIAIALIAVGVVLAALGTAMLQEALTSTNQQAVNKDATMDVVSLLLKQRYRAAMFDR